MPRKSLEEKEQLHRNKIDLISAAESGGDWKKTAIELNISRTTAYRWIKDGVKPDARGGNYRKKFNKEHVDFIISCIEDDNTITLHGIKQKFELHFPQLSISKTSIARHLDLSLYTLKKLRFDPEEANCEINKIKRKEFAEKYLKFQSENRPICFMDESNFNLHISRTEERSLKGTRCTTLAAASEGSNIHLIGCISNLGLIYYEIQRGAFKKEQACHWMKNCLRQARIKHDGPVIMVLDNALAHSGIEVLQLEEFNDFHILCLGPYSPMLNPVEHVWSKIKAHVKRDISSLKNQILFQQGKDLSIIDYRTGILEKITVDRIKTITSDDCVSFISEIQKNIGDMLNMVNTKF
ncbi:uncharacterized protein LOC115231662 [Octopus sinensis]|uniref:Uncharacterized protein LOC115231662 n=1 Tax=Octopus sinensis TaxID=2607531 RepID=A0A6P7U961_9MOLL|nr:uncharacterized protein LOC115231662 [Octopus sinensis]